VFANVEFSFGAVDDTGLGVGGGGRGARRGGERGCQNRRGGGGRRHGGGHGGSLVRMEVAWCMTLAMEGS
jgi:hypothetical protein